MDSALVLLGSNRLADALFVTGPVAALHELRRDLAIIVVTGAIPAQILETAPAVAASVVVDHRPAALTAGLYARAAARGIALALDRLGLASDQARVVALFDRPAYRDVARRLHTSFQLKDIEAPGSPTGHRTQRMAQALAPFGLPPAKAPMPYRVYPSLADAQLAARELEALGLGGDGAPFCVLHPGSRERASLFSWPEVSREWGVLRYTDLARALSLSGLAVVITWHGRSEGRLARGIAAAVQAAGGAPVLASPALPARALAALLARARVVVSNDTGPLHLAAAVGTACVGIYGPTRPSETGPVGPPNKVKVFAPAAPGPCDAPVPEVAQAVRRLAQAGAAGTRDR